MIDFCDRNTCGLQTVLNRVRGKTGAVFDAIEALFFRRSDQFTIADNRRRCITVIGINSENQHRASAPHLAALGACENIF